MRRTLLTILCSVFAVATLSGCWNRRELNELSIATAMGLDKSTGDNLILSVQLLYAQAISRKSGGGGDRAPVVLMEESGVGTQNALRKITMKSPRKIYAGQLQMLVIGEEMARSGELRNVLEHIVRDHEYRKDFYVVVAKGREARDILKVFTPLESIPANKLRSSLQSSSKVFGASGAIILDEFLSSLLANGKEAVLTGVALGGKLEQGSNKKNVEPIAVPANLEYTGFAVFKQDKLIGWLNQEESIGLNYVKGNVKSTVESFPCPGEKETATVELLRTKAKIKIKMVNAEPVVHIKLSGEGNVSELQCPMDLSNPDEIAKLEKLVNEKIKEKIETSVKTVQKKYKSDIFGFGEAVNRSNPKYWKTAKTKWSKIFPDLQVEVTADIRIREIFKTRKSLSERMKE